MITHRYGVHSLSRSNESSNACGTIGFCWSLLSQLADIHSSMPKRATVRFQALQTCLVNLPLSIYGQLVSRQVTPQSLVVCLSYSPASGDSTSSKTEEQQRVYVGWSGMPARLLGGIAGVGKGEEAVEIDPVCAKELGIPEGAEVCFCRAS